MFPSSSAAKLFLYVLFCTGFVSQFCIAQGPLPTAAVPASALPVEAVAAMPNAPEMHHPFWDKQNKLLFTLVGISSAADFAVTHSNLANGGRELNPIANAFVGSSAGQAVNFMGGAVGTVGVSYLFHKTGHHKMERVASMVQIGGSSFAVAYGLSHR